MEAIARGCLAAIAYGRNFDQAEFLRNCGYCAAAIAYFYLCVPRSLPTGARARRIDMTVPLSELRAHRCRQRNQLEKPLAFLRSHLSAAGRIVTGLSHEHVRVFARFFLCLFFPFLRWRRAGGRWSRLFFFPVAVRDILGGLVARHLFGNLSTSPSEPVGEDPQQVRPSCGRGLTEFTATAGKIAAGRRSSALSK